MGNNNTKTSNNDLNPVLSQNQSGYDPKTVRNPYQEPKTPELKSDNDDLKRLNLNISKNKPQEPIIDATGQSFKPKKFDKEKFKLANQPYKSIENVSSVATTALMDDEDEKLMNSILNKI